MRKVKAQSPGILYIYLYGLGLVLGFFWCWNYSLAQEAFLATECWLRALKLLVQHLNICIIIPHLLHKAVMQFTGVVHIWDFFSESSY